jgi:hypothetical protein
LANQAVITQMLWLLNERRQAFAWVARLGQTRVRHTWLLNTGPGGYDNCASDLHQLSGMAQRKVLHGVNCLLNITTSMINRILVSREDHTKWLTVNDDTFQSDEI